MIVLAKFKIFCQLPARESTVDAKPLKKGLDKSKTNSGPSELLYKNISTKQIWVLLTYFERLASKKSESRQTFNAEFI